MAPKRASAESSTDAVESTNRRSTRNGGVQSTSTASTTATSKKTEEPSASVPKESVTHAVTDASVVGGEEETEALAPPAAKKAKKDSVYKVGDIVEDIELKDENDELVSLKSLYEVKGLVIFSYPRANTPGCTNQACGFRDLDEQFTELGYRVLGLSTDKPGAQASWKKGKSLPCTLLSDPKKELLSRLGATEAKKRCHWVIEKGGRLAEQDIGVKPASDPTNALNIVKALASTTNGKV